MLLSVGGMKKPRAAKICSGVGKSHEICVNCSGIIEISGVFGEPITTDDLYPTIQKPSPWYRQPCSIWYSRNMLTGLNSLALVWESH
jgi:hypothetical protein